MDKQKLIIKHVYIGDFDPNDFFADPQIWEDYIDWLGEEKDIEEYRWEYIREEGMPDEDTIGVSNVKLEYMYSDFD